jgi:sterol desaturase/sphingolipid hydroxylase (fatty acid hydroxylase superfamily)
VLIAFVARTVVGYGSFLGFVAIVLAAELRFPRERTITHDGRVRAILFFLLYIPVAVACGLFIRVPVPRLALLGGVGAFAAPFVWDFFYYWLHRAQHAIPFLWRFHAVHHSARELGAGAGFHHFAEEPLRILFVSAPLALFVNGMGWAAIILAAQGVYLHSTTRLHLGRFAWIVADNRVHRVHHSTEARHLNKNFGAFTLLWDRLFGTDYFPHDEWPDIGLSDRREPRTFRAYVLAPFARYMLP